MLRQRITTALVLGFIAIGAMLWSGSAFAVVVTVLLGLALTEWLQLAGAPRPGSTMLAVFVSAVLLVLIFASSNAVGAVVLPLSTLAVAIWLAIAVALTRAAVIGKRLPRTASIVLAAVLVLAAWFALMRLLSQGILMLLSVLCIVWIADTAAYFSGRAFGRRKLAPHISPGKTWAGVVGAMVAVVLVAIAVHQFIPGTSLYSNELFAAIGPLCAPLVLALLVVLSIVGDLFESLLKRQAGVKDSGQLLPGHGGVLDRVDAMVPVLPSAVVVQWLIR